VQADVLDTVVALCDQIESVKTEDWQKRLGACQALTELFIEYEHTPEVFNIDVFRALKEALKSTLQDLRSGLVKEACITLSKLSEVCRGRMRPLSNEMIPVLITQRGVGNKVIVGHINACTQNLIKFTPTRSTIPYYCDQIKHNKNKDLRECCMNCIFLLLVCNSKKASFTVVLLV
jgi:hypothetical protein